MAQRTRHQPDRLLSPSELEPYIRFIRQDQRYAAIPAGEQGYYRDCERAWMYECASGPGVGHGQGYQCHTQEPACGQDQGEFWLRQL